MAAPPPLQPRRRPPADAVEPELSLSDFRGQLFHRFQQSGVLGSLKAQLRTRLIEQFEPGLHSATAGATTTTTTSHGAVSPLEQRVVNGLIGEYLAAAGYTCTLGVFTSESHTPVAPMEFERDELLQLLRIEASSSSSSSSSSFPAQLAAAIGGEVESLHLRQRDFVRRRKFLSHQMQRSVDETSLSSVPDQQQQRERHAQHREQALLTSRDAVAENCAAYQGSLLFVLLRAVKQLNVTSLESAVRTSEAECQVDTLGASAGDTLTDKLRAVDEQYSHRVHELDALPLQSIEERMRKYQREVDAQAKREIAAEVERIRAQELSSMRLEEAAQYRHDVERVREEAQRVIAARMEEFQKREDELLEQVRRKEQAIEGARFEQRQQLLAEMQRLRAKEQLMREQSELQAKQVEFEMARLREKQAVLDDKIMSLPGVEELEKLQRHHRRGSSMSAPPDDEAHEQHPLPDSLDADGDDEHDEHDERHKYYDASRTMEALENELNLLEDNNQVLEERLDALMEENQQLQSQLNRAKKKIAAKEGDVKRLQAVVQQYRQRAQNIEAEQKTQLEQLVRAHDESLRNERAAVASRQAEWDRTLAMMRDDLDDRIAEEERLRQQLEDVELEKKHLRREVEHLEHMLKRKAAQKEVLHAGVASLAREPAVQRELPVKRSAAPTARRLAFSPLDKQLAAAVQEGDWEEQEEEDVEVVRELEDDAYQRLRWLKRLEKENDSVKTDVSEFLDTVRQNSKRREAGQSSVQERKKQREAWLQQLKQRKAVEEQQKEMAEEKPAVRSMLVDLLREAGLQPQQAAPSTPQRKRRPVSVVSPFPAKVPVTPSRQQQPPPPTPERAGDALPTEAAGLAAFASSLTPQRGFATQQREQADERAEQYRQEVERVREAARQRAREEEQLRREEREEEELKARLRAELEEEDKERQAEAAALRREHEEELARQRLQAEQKRNEEAAERQRQREQAEQERERQREEEARRAREAEEQQQREQEREAREKEARARREQQEREARERQERLAREAKEREEQQRQKQERERQERLAREQQEKEEKEARERQEREEFERRLEADARAAEERRQAQRDARRRQREAKLLEQQQARLREQSEADARVRREREQQAEREAARQRQREEDNVADALTVDDLREDDIFSIDEDFSSGPDDDPLF